MKFGICQDPIRAIDNFPNPADYIEISASSVYNYSDEAFLKVKKAVDDGMIKTYSANGLVIPDLRLTGGDVNFEAIRNYCDKTFYKLAELGVSMLVFGSGKAKHVPDGFSMEKAWDQLFEVGRIFSEKAKPFGQIIAVEPLSYNEVNIVNTVEDGAFYVSNVNCGNFRLLVDFYHFFNNKEDVSSIVKNAHLLEHVHFASKVRAMPKNEEEWMHFRSCIKLLSDIGYKAGVSFEGAAVEGMTMGGFAEKMKENASLAISE